MTEGSFDCPSSGTWVDNDWFFFFFWWTVPLTQGILLSCEQIYKNSSVTFFVFTTVSLFIFSNSSHTYKQPVQNGWAFPHFSFFFPFFFFHNIQLASWEQQSAISHTHFAIFKLNIFCAIQNKCTHTFDIFCLQKNKKIAVIYKSHNKKGKHSPHQFVLTLNSAESVFAYY